MQLKHPNVCLVIVSERLTFVLSSRRCPLPPSTNTNIIIIYFSSILFLIWEFVKSKLISGKEGTIPSTLAICHYITHAINHLLGIPTWDTAHTQFISEPSANPSEIVLTNYNCNEWHLSQYCKSPILQRNRFVDVFLLKHISWWVFVKRIVKVQRTS